MQFLKGYFRRFRLQIFGGQFFKLIEAVLELFLPLVMADLIDRGIKTGDTAYVFSRSMVMLGIAAVGLLTALVCQVVASYASQNFGTQLRSDVFRHINRLSHADIDTLGTPSLITRMTNDINQLQQAMAMLIRLVVRAPFLVIGSIVMAMMLDMKLSVVFLVIAPLLALVIYVVMRKSMPFFRRMQRQLDGIGRITRENLEGARIVRAFSKQETEVREFDAATQDYADTAVRVAQISATLGPMTGIIMNVGILAILLLGGGRVNAGVLDQGIIIAFIQYVIQISLQIVIVANLVVLFTKAGASAQRIGEVLSMVPSVKGGGAAMTPDAKKAAVAFENVSFCYAGAAQNALEDIAFCVERKQTVGIIGGTGSGKSTLVQLIPRFYDATTGTVRVWGEDVRTYVLSSLRTRVGTVPQHAVLMRGSIRRNMRWGKKDASDEEIWAALHTAQAAGFVQALPGKLDFLIEEGGKNLSGGQRQRLTIARALVGQPSILILDDSASALDFATDAALRRAIYTDTDDMTVFLVSQRASTIRQADKIIVLDDGHIVGNGTHAELMRDCDVYREICLSQQADGEVSA